MFSPDSQIIVSAGSGDGQVKRMKLDGTVVNTIKGSGYTVNSVAFSPDGLMLALASYEGKISLWKVMSSDVTFERDIIENNDSDSRSLNHVNRVVFSADGQMIASASGMNHNIKASDNKYIKLWDVNGALLSALPVNYAAWSVDLSSDGTRLVSASNGTMNLWNLNLDDLISRGCDWARDYLKNTKNPNVSESDRHLCDR
jgi:WD40 repeat protein